MLGIYELSLQKAHCQGQTRAGENSCNRRFLNGVFFQRPGLHHARKFIAGFGQSVLSISSQSAINLAPLPSTTLSNFQVQWRDRKTIFPRPSTYVIEFLNRYHLINGYRCMKSPGNNYASRINLLEKLCTLDCKRVITGKHAHN